MNIEAQTLPLRKRGVVPASDSNKLYCWGLFGEGGREWKQLIVLRVLCKGVMTGSAQGNTCIVLGMEPGSSVYKLSALIYCTTSSAMGRVTTATGKVK